MQKINFQNLPSTATPINATNLNAIQSNVEDVFDGSEPMGNIVVDSIRSKNMFNKSAIQINKYIPDNSTSETLADGYAPDNVRTTNWIKCKPNTTYTISGNVNRKKFQFKNASNVITFQSYGDSTANFTTLSDSVYFRIYFYKGDNPVFDDVQIEEGSTATDYAPYQGLGYVSGSNANGNYIKYDDGTLMQWGNITKNLTVTRTSSAGGYYDDGYGVQLPQSFVDTTYYANVMPAKNSNPTLKVYSITKNASNEFVFNLASQNSYSQNNFPFVWEAIGRWK